MAKAKKVSDIPGRAAENADRKAKKDRHTARLSALSTKTFEELSNAEKDRLLKALGVARGLIEDSDDS